MKNHPEIYKGKSFAKGMEDIKLDCLLKHYYIESLWKDDKENTYAFYYQTGLKMIPKDIYENLRKKCAKSWN